MKVCLQEDNVCGAEALVRWEHPELGFLYPDEFIPAAEQSGIIVHLTRYVLTEAVRQCRQWLDEGLDLNVSVNLSVRDLLDEYLPYHVLQIRNIPLHELKIDKSFIMTIMDDPQNEAIVKTTVDLAHNLDLSVVVEGVENEAIMRRVAAPSCEQAQGYFLSKPVPADELANWANNYQAVIYSERRQATILR